ncbi:MAG: choice-of-anchor R domain-containing protein [Pseudanabaena sp. ELA607]
MNDIKPNNLRTMVGVTNLCVGILTISNPADAITLIGNYSSTNDGSVTFISTSARQKAIGFTLPTGKDYILDSITLRLQNYSTTANDVARLRIYQDVNKTSTNPNGAILQSVMFTNPSSSSNKTNNFTFTPTSTITFKADTRYWLLVDATAGNYNWRANNAGITPTGISGITFDSYEFSANDGTTYTSSLTFNSFNIQVTEVVATPNSL